MKHKGIGRMHPAVRIAAGAVFGLGVFFGVTTLGAFYLTRNDAPVYMPLTILTFSVFAGALIAGFFAKYRLRERGLLPILAVWGAYLLPILGVLAAVNGFRVSVYLAIAVPASFAGAMLGGGAASRIRR